MKRVIIIFPFLLSFFILTGCQSVTMPVSVTGRTFAVCYSDLPYKTIRSFDRIVVIRYWMNSIDSENITVEQVMNEEIAATPGAKGIKNLKVRIYSRSWDSFQCINYIGYVKVIYGTILGFTWRSFQVKGDIY